MNDIKPTRGTVSQKELSHVRNALQQIARKNAQKTAPIGYAVKTVHVHYLQENSKIPLHNQLVSVGIEYESNNRSARPANFFHQYVIVLKKLIANELDGVRKPIRPLNKKEAIEAQSSALDYQTMEHLITKSFYQEHGLDTSGLEKEGKKLIKSRIDNINRMVKELKDTDSDDKFEKPVVKLAETQSLPGSENIDTETPLYDVREKYSKKIKKSLEDLKRVHGKTKPSDVARQIENLQRLGGDDQESLIELSNPIKRGYKLNLLEEMKKSLAADKEADSRIGRGYKRLEQDKGTRKPLKTGYHIDDTDRGIDPENTLKTDSGDGTRAPVKRAPKIKNEERGLPELE